jgi:hypothetical protein
MRDCATEEFPDTGLKFPDLLNIFPVNLRRELLEKRLQRNDFSLQNRLYSRFRETAVGDRVRSKLRGAAQWKL